MAKFTKLNIGDSVASSGGRVWKKLSAESEVDNSDIIGTWVFNDTLTEFISADTTATAYFTFNSNDNTYKQLSQKPNALNQYYLEYSSDGVSGDAPYWFVSTVLWKKPLFQTIEITSEVSKVVINGEEQTDGIALFIAWLQANATKIA